MKKSRLGTPEHRYCDRYCIQGYHLRQPENIEYVMRGDPLVYDSLDHVFYKALSRREAKWATGAYAWDNRKERRMMMALVMGAVLKFPERSGVKEL